MHVRLPPELEKLIKDKVGSGFYTNASEVVRDALRMMAERDRGYHLELQHLREAVRPALAQAEHGDTVDFDPDRIAALADREN